MKITLISVAFISAFFFIACETPTTKAPSTPTADSDTTDLSKLTVPDAKTLDTSKIPKYRTMDAQGATESLGHIDMAVKSTCTGIPTKISDLNSGTEFNIYKYDFETKASASAMGFTGSFGKKDVVFVQDYVRWADADCDGVKKRYGIGLRCFIHVTRIKGGLSGGFSGIAASVELDRGEATYNLKALGFGIEGVTIANGLSSVGEYDVDNFSKLAIVYNETLKLLNNNSTIVIKPVELP